MKAIRMRDLKRNPSGALREARRHPLVVLNRDQPEALLVHLDDDALLAEPGVRRALATALYREQSISLGQAARVAVLSVAEFMLHVSRAGIPVIRSGITDVRDDARKAMAWQKSSSSRTRPL